MWCAGRATCHELYSLWQTSISTLAYYYTRTLHFVAEVNFNARILLSTNSTVCGRSQLQRTHITIYVSSYCYICGAQGGGERPGTLPSRQHHATSTSAHTAYSPDQAACNYSRELQSGEPEPPRDYDLRRHELVRVLCRIDSLETSCLLGLPLLLFSVFFFHFSFGLAELTHVMPLTKALLSPRSRFIFFFSHFTGRCLRRFRLPACAHAGHNVFFLKHVSFLCQHVRTKACRPYC